VVTEHSALTVAACWCAVTTIAGDIAALPLFLYRVLPGGGKEKYTGHPLYRLLHDSPNPGMTSLTFRETILLSALIYGNGYAEIQRDGGARPVALWPITPDRVVTWRAGSDAPLQYKISNSGAPDTVLDAEDVLHIKGPSSNGINGHNVVALARETLGLSLASEQFAARFFSNGSSVGGILTSPGSLPEAARKNLREALQSRHQGTEHAHKLLLLDNGVTYTPTAVSQRDAQFSELRTFEIRQIARFYKIPVSLLGDLERSTFSNHEQQVLSYYTSCLRPWLIRFEQECDLKLIASSERNLQHVEHSVDGFLRGDVEKRSAYYATMSQNGLMTANEIRQLENLPPVAGGDVLRAPLNSAPTSTAGRSARGWETREEKV
jgi:HK97 family phage portal protein